MTRKEAWVRFMAGAMAGDTKEGFTTSELAGFADEAMAELDRRVAAGKLEEAPRGPVRFVGDDVPSKRP